MLIYEDGEDVLVPVKNFWLVDALREEIAEKDRALSEKDRALSEKDQALSEKDQALSEKDQELAALRKKLKDTGIK